MVELPRMTVTESTLGKDTLAAESLPPFRWGVVGLGGYGGFVADMIYKAAAEDPVSANASLKTVCDPALELHAKRADELRAKGVKVFRDFADLLREPIDAVWLPVPIHLHAAFTAKALAAGKAVLCEKPAAGDVEDVDAMIAARDRTGLPVAVAYQNMYDPDILDLKRRLLAGELGKILSATVMGCWPRDSAYFARNNWAGKMRFGDHWVLDSPLSNAMSHYMQLPLFLLGASEKETAIAHQVESELYRANPIENFDTCSVRVSLGGDLKLLVLFTHASAKAIDPRIRIYGEKGTVVVRPEKNIEWQVDGKSTVVPMTGKVRFHMMVAFRQWLAGQTPRGAIGTLEVARAPVVVVNAASEASAVRVVDEQYVDVIPGEGSRTLRVIEGIDEIFDECVKQKKMISEAGSAPWAAAGGRLNTEGYCGFKGPAAK